MPTHLERFDWSATPLGPREAWSPALRTTHDLMMATRFPMCATWGPARTLLYNEAYAPFLGTRHPAALGRPIDEVWFEIWDDIRPLIEQAMAGQPVHQTDMHLVMTRNGRPEDTYWTFSYSPLRDGDAVVGFLNVAMETTEAVEMRRHMAKESARLQDSESRLLALVTAGAYSLYRMSPDWQEMRHLDGQGVLRDTLSPSVRWLDVYIDEADRATVLAAVAEAIAREDTFELEHRVRLAEGGFGWVLSRAVPIRDGDGRVVEWFGAATDITARRAAEARQDMLNHELSHRLKNSLAIVQSIATQTLRNASDLASAHQSLMSRLVALGRAHDVLLSGQTNSAHLRGIAAGALELHDDAQARIRVSGPDVAVGPVPALYFTLMLHELATNAAKYGALSVPAGSVDVVWTIDSPSQTFRMTWTEMDGPPVAPPTRKGFGSRLIERGLAGTVDGEVVFRFEPGGVVCSLTAPLSGLVKET